MGRLVALVYGGLSYALFLGVFVYLVGFLTNAWVPRSIDDALTAGSTAAAIAIDLALVSLFALQHTAMARPGFKRRWARALTPAIERSTFVLAASASLAVLVWQWRALPEPIWQIEAPALRAALWALFALGLGIVLLSTFLIDHFALFGLRQVFDHWRGASHDGDDGFRAPLLYRFVRHPMMVGLVILFWATPSMTHGHALFAGAMTAYLIAGVQLEERDLGRALGDDYARYQREVPQLIPRLTPWVRR